PSSFENPVVIMFVIVMLILLLIIALLSNLLLGVAQVKAHREKEKADASKLLPPAIIACLLLGNPAFSQSAASTISTTSSSSWGISGLSTEAFYLMASVLFVELLVIFLLLMNVRGLLRAEKQATVTRRSVIAWKQQWASWWTKLNQFRPVEKEADIDLGHDYDGIRELDNRLPPWWLYGFYLTILTAGIYLYRFHVSHTGPSSEQEYVTAIAKADREVKEYLEKKGDQVDENTVAMLTAAEELAEGKAIFMQSCVACHSEGGAGSVGPNLTDDYWLHGGDIKSIFKTIRYGVNAMPQWQNNFSNKQIAELASYVKSLKGTHPANPKPPQGALFNEEGNTKNTTDSTKNNSRQISAVPAK
ncbi:MAG TPA: cbb3-type cytochrome c oxidase N-terminal domain-containing protein, partial [Chitinophagaceae bacterium]|nr:cbb3-type cytochrome c oxidase N-terminal domain-containing protein [Chitinophagaceae bacterium]